jgi:hypothetical protein
MSNNGNLNLLLHHRILSGHSRRQIAQPAYCGRVVAVAAPERLDIKYEKNFQIDAEHHLQAFAASVFEVDNYARLQVPYAVVAACFESSERCFKCLDRLSWRRGLMEIRKSAFPPHCRAESCCTGV